jgi:Rad3-related DNA helicase
LPGFEPREPQRELATDVYDALFGSRALLGEAPTGVGKSLAYLVPALLWSRAHGEPVVISTYTKSLQDQLSRQDVPQLSRLADRPAHVVVLKGRSNYLCPRRFRLARHEAKGGKVGVLEGDFTDWADATGTGDFDEFLAPLSRRLRLKVRVASDAAFCGPAICKMGGDCPFRRARRDAASAEIVIVNHALVSGRQQAACCPRFAR